MTSWLGDQAEKIIVSILHQGKDTVKIWRWLLNLFLRYLKHKIHEIWPLTFICIAKDGLMSTCCYYIIWLVDHTAYACKIWARLDQWLLKYNTKRGLTFDLHLHSQDGLMSTWCYYVIWLADHITYAYKIWAWFDQWFLRYKRKWDLTFDLHLHNQDGLISTWRYYVICLSGHTPYAYKIWAQLDQWFVRYKTREIWPLTFICIAKMASYQLDVIM